MFHLKLESSNNNYELWNAENSEGDLVYIYSIFFLIPEAEHIWIFDYF